MPLPGLIFWKKPLPWAPLAFPSLCSHRHQRMLALSQCRKRANTKASASCFPAHRSNGRTAQLPKILCGIQLLPRECASTAQQWILAWRCSLLIPNEPQAVFTCSVAFHLACVHFLDNVYAPSFTDGILQKHINTRRLSQCDKMKSHLSKHWLRGQLSGQWQSFIVVINSGIYNWYADKLLPTTVSVTITNRYNLEYFPTPCISCSLYNVSRLLN